MKKPLSIPFIVTLLILILVGPGCGIRYIIHAGVGQFRMLHHSVPVDEALQDESLKPEYKDHLKLVAEIKDFGEKELGLKKTQNYQTVFNHLFENKVFFEELWIIEVFTPGEYDGMVASLAHAPNRWDTHRKKEDLLLIPL